MWLYCGYLGSTPECFTLTEATDFVKKNYAIVNFDYADFNEPNYMKQEAVSMATIVGTVGTCMFLVVRQCESVFEMQREAGRMVRGPEREAGIAHG